MWLQNYPFFVLAPLDTSAELFKNACRGFSSRLIRLLHWTEFILEDNGPLISILMQGIRFLIKTIYLTDGIS